MIVTRPPVLYVNTVDLAEYGLVVEGVDGLFSLPDRTDLTVELPQGAGVALADAPGRVAARAVTVDGTMTAATQPLLERGLAQLKAACAAGTVELRVGAASRPVCFARLAACTVTLVAPQLRATHPVARVSLRWVAADPWLWDPYADAVAFGDTPSPIELGTAPSRGRDWYGATITIHGPATTPTLREHDATGAVRRTMAFTWSPTAADALEIDVGRGLVTRIQSGARDNAVGLLADGWAFPALDPDDGWFAGAQWPGLSVSSGTGVVHYRRAWR